MRNIPLTLLTIFLISASLWTASLGTAYANPDGPDKNIKPDKVETSGKRENAAPTSAAEPPKSAGATEQPKSAETSQEPKSAEAAQEPKSGQADRYYAELCASCHNVNRLGKTASPLVPQTLKKYSDDELRQIILNGLRATEMPSFPALSADALNGLIAIMRSPVEIKWDMIDIDESAETLPARKTTPPKYGNIENVTTVVERGANRVWIMEDKNILDRFDFKNVHGGLKFSPDGRRIFVPSVDGYVGRYDLSEGLQARVRACLNLRNIALTRDGKRIIVACVLPSSLVALDAASMRPEKVIPMEDAVSAVAALYFKDIAYVTFKDRPRLGVMDTSTLALGYKELDAPLEDFFIDPFERYIVGAARKDTSPKSKTLRTYDIAGDIADNIASDNLKPRVVFDYPIEGFPHLFSAAFMYIRDGFYFVAPHIGKPYVSVWRMYADEKASGGKAADKTAGKFPGDGKAAPFGFDRVIDVGGGGMFARTHPASPYIFADRGTDELTLISKIDFSVRHIVPVKGQKVVHTEFSGDGRIAYVSVGGDDGFVILYDASTLKEFKRIPAKMPFGAGNYFNKERRFAPVNLGREVYNARCRGCHQYTQQTLAPSFKRIAETRDEAEIRAYIKAPKAAAAMRGNRMSTMPALGMTPTEIESVVRYILYLKEFGRR
jgi:mono/diheme cytochrome c family protein